MKSEGPKEVWIFAEIDGGGLKEVVFELASEGRRLADKLGERLCAVLVAEDPKDFSKGLSQYGVDTIFCARSEYGVDAYIHILSHLMRKYNPRLLLVGATPLGSEIAPRIAAKNEIRIVTDCEILGYNDWGCFEVTKMIYGDKVYATYAAPVTKAQIVTVRPGAFDLRKQNTEKTTQLVIESVEINGTLFQMKYLDFVKGDPKNIDIAEAEIIVAVGGGVGGQEGLKKIEQLAEMLEASLGGSRVAVDRGLLPFERQIGQTGKTVSPKLLICCGISGAFEFIAGIKDSRLIVSINNDTKAPIFSISNLSLVGDLHIVIPEIVEQLKKNLEEGTE